MKLRAMWVLPLLLMVGQTAPGTGTRPATQSKATGGSVLEAKLNSLPKNLMPSEGEQPIKEQSRSAWVREITKSPFGPIILEVTIQKVSTGKLVTRNPATGFSTAEDRVQVRGDIAPLNVWGKERRATDLAFILENVMPLEAVEWKQGDKILISTKVSAITVSSESVVLSFASSTKIK